MPAMRLKQAFLGVFCRLFWSSRAFSFQTQTFLTAVDPVTIVPFQRSQSFRSTCNLILGQIKNLSKSRLPSYKYKQCSQPTRIAACYFSSNKQPLALTMAESLSSRSDNGCSVSIGEEGKQKVQESHVGEDTEIQSTTESGLTETVTCSKSGTENEQRQAPSCSDQCGEEMEVEPQEAEELADNNRTTSQKTKPATRGNKPGDVAKVSLMSKRAQKKLLRKEKFKEQRKAKRSGQFTNNSSPGFDSDLFSQTDYYFENGLRKVYPYRFTFSTYAKERWYGRTLQEIFEHEFRVDSPDNFRTSVANGFMKVNGKVATLDHVIHNGDFIEHDIHRHENPVTGAPIEVLEDTEEVVVINKPPSIPCHPCGKFRFNSIVFIMGKELGYANLRNIYRLDRLTSGVLVLGKTARKTKELENHVLHRRVHKEYLARVIGEFPPEEVTLDRPLDCLSHKLTLWRVVEKGGKPSQTTFQRVSYNGQTSVVRCIPHTGRTHQIRVHLQYLGHPIVNDPYYNSPAWGPQRGKGGRYDVSFEELCQRIMEEHNVGLWCDGENPLFKQRLAETHLSQNPSLHAEGKSTPVVCRGANIPPQSEGNGQSDSQLSSEDAPPAKKLRLATLPLSPRPSTESRDVADSSELPPSSTLPSSHSQVPVSAKSECETDGNSADVNPTPPRTSVLCPVSENNTNCALESSVVVGDSSVQEDCSTAAGEATVSKVGDGGVERRGFDPERWVPDPHCHSCRLKYIDPKPSDLLLYLHALRYKGPGWDYSTKLPEWASDDWQEPDDYSKYLQ